MVRASTFWLLGALVFVPAAAATAQPVTGPSPTPAGASSSSPPTADSIDSAPEQVVWLRSGAILRGRIVEYAPGERVVLQLATRELRTVAWTDIARASFVASSPQVPASSAPSPGGRQSAEAPAPSAPTGSVRFRLHPSDMRLRLESKSMLDIAEAWTEQCRAPCDRWVPVEDRSFRVGGDGIPPSNTFRVEEDGKVARLVVRPGSERTLAWGRGTLITGAIVGLASGALYGAGHLEDSDPMRVAGLVGMGLGAVSVLASVPLLMSGRTTVRDSTGRHVARESTRWPTF